MNIVNPNAHHRLLARLARAATAYLEIGCCEGASLLTVLRSGPPQFSVVCDTWGTIAGGTGRRSNAHIRAMLDAEPVRHKVTFLDGDSRKTVPRIQTRFDLINVDGDHSYEGAALDLMHTWPLLLPGGVIVLDDIDHPQHAYLRTLMERFSAVINCQPFHVESTDYGVCAWRKPV